MRDWGLEASWTKSPLQKLSCPPTPSWPLPSSSQPLALLVLMEGRTRLHRPPQRPEAWQKHKLTPDAPSLRAKMALPFSTSYTFSSLSRFFSHLRLPWRLLWPQCPVGKSGCERRDKDTARSASERPASSPPASGRKMRSGWFGSYRHAPALELQMRPSGAL